MQLSNGRDTRPGAAVRTTSVLLVEDDLFSATVTGDALRVGGYGVHHVADGLSALAALERERFDLVITDWNMPGMDGIELCRAIRAHPTLMETYVLMLSATRGTTPLVHALRAGADDYLTKPAEPEELLAKVEAAYRVVSSQRTATRLAAEQASLLGVATAVAGGMAPTALFDLVAREVAGLLGIGTGLVFAFEGSAAVRVGGWILDHVPDDDDHRLDGDGVLARVRQTGLPVRIEARERPGGDPGAGVVHSRHRCSIAAPIRVGDRPWGAVLASASTVNAFSRDAEQMLAGFAELLALAIAKDESRAQREVITAELRRAQRLEAVGHLAAGVAHEINTPIQFVGNSIDFLGEAFTDLSALIGRYRAALQSTAEPGRAGLAEAEGEIDLEYLLEKVPEAIAWSQEGVGRVTRIVRAMKDFTHPTNEDRVPADLNKAIMSTLTIASSEIARVADISTDLAELSPVLCNVGDVNQVVLNLLLNAGHAIADTPGAERGTIHVSTRADGDAVIIAVADSGSGIPLEVQEHIFDPFFTTKEVGRGTGQGLALAWALVVDKHGGGLTFDSRPGQGTTFYVRLPRESSVAPTGGVS